jgi:predicted secreted protein with PEFG-CTERM motif
MSTHKEYALIAILATAAVMGVVPAFADPTTQAVQAGGIGSQQVLPIAVWTDNDTYTKQSVITVSGHVLNPITGQTVTLRVSDSQGNVVEIEQLTIDNNGNFQDKINAASPLWTSGGTYTVYAQYGSQQGLRSASTQFSLPGGGETSCTSTQLSVTVGNELHCIDYSVNGGSVLGASLSQLSKSLTVNIQADNDGQITLDIPRSVMDAKSGDKDSSYVVLVDGEQIDQFTDSSTADTRSITIPFQAGTEKIEIIGTQIVPEFGPIAALVLAIAIVSIIAVSAKTGLRLMPRY